MADTKNIKVKIESDIEKYSKAAAKTQFGKHYETSNSGEMKAVRGPYKDISTKGEGLLYEKGTGSNRGVTKDIQSKILMKPFNKIDEDISEGDEDAGQEVNAKNRQAIKAVFRENIAPAIASSRIGFDRNQGNLARAKIKQHDIEKKAELKKKIDDSKDKIGQKNKNIEQYKKLEQNANDTNINFKGDDKYLKQQKKDIKQEKKEIRKEKKEYKKDKKKYQKKAYKDNGLKKFSLGNSLFSATKGYLPQIDFIDTIKNFLSASKMVLKILTGFGSLISFLINLIIMCAPVLIIIIVIFCTIGLFFNFVTGETNNYLESTKITEKYETLMQEYADSYFNAPLTNKFDSYQKYDEIVIDNKDPYYNYEQNKLSAFLNVYLGDEINNKNYADDLCSHFFKSCFKITERYEAVEYQEKVWDYLIHEYTYETKTKIVLHLNWTQDKTLDEWINEQWDKVNPYYEDYDKELAQEQFKNYIDPQGINQILSSPFEEGSSKITSQYGCRIDPINGGYNCSHSGVDYAAKNGTPLHAVYDGGIVQEVKWHDGGGNMLSVLYTIGDEQYLVRYAHLSKINVSVGDTVNKSDVIALSGDTGAWVTGPHLHLEVYLGDKVNLGKQINPLFIVAN